MTEPEEAVAKIVDALDSMLGAIKAQAEMTSIIAKQVEKIGDVVIKLEADQRLMREHQEEPF